MKILVTGGTGYIGSHTVVLLIQEGYEVIILDNLSNSKIEVLDSIKEITNIKPQFYQVDLLDYDGVKKIFQENEISGVIHFAGLKAVGESVRIPLDYYNNNITGTLNLLRIMNEHNVKNIIFSSSATVYGMNNESPLYETMPLSTTNPYGATKRMIEDIMRDLYVSDNEWSIVLLRYFNPIGAHESALIGENPNGIPNNLLPYIALVAVGKLDHLNVFGNDYDTIDGTGVRDYIHVVDLAMGHIKALKYAMDHTGAEAINLGTGNGTSVLEIVKAFESASGQHIEYVIQPRRPGDVATCFANSNKAKELLGWSATKNINDMCVDGWNFIAHVTNN
ncbi:MAG: UDP-glucose 4-epimerase GalE [Candidatus Epulonipiscioides saccharophilum]|nr:MAG: UDP-glucose 4-epimerase GalE [Epulopiscium sp. AS2M-Bin001]